MNSDIRYRGSNESSLNGPHSATALGFAQMVGVRPAFLRLALMLGISVTVALTVNASTLSTISFAYSGVDTTGIGGSSSGSGNFSIAVGSQNDLGLEDLFSFSFSQTTVVPVGSGSSTFSYGLADLTDFSLTLGTGLYPSLSLSTDAVAGTDPTFFPESFSSNADVGQTYNSFGDPLQLGTVAVNQTSVCQAVLAGAVDPVSLGTSMFASFTPNFSLNLNQAAAACGVAGFNWQQTLTVPEGSPSPYFAAGSNSPLTGTFIDPPPGGYDTGNHLVNDCNGQSVYVHDDPGGEISYPFYWGSGELARNESGGTMLGFSDTPADSCLSPGQALDFTTTLVGVDAGGGVVTLPQIDEFSWSSDFDGTVLGGEATKNVLPVDPGSGTGGTELISNVSAAEAPEPSSIVLLTSGLVLMIIGTARRKHSALKEKEDAS